MEPGARLRSRATSSFSSTRLAPWRWLVPRSSVSPWPSCNRARFTPLAPCASPHSRVPTWECSAKRSKQQRRGPKSRARL
ncbi:MAG: hypothetical protein MZV64_10200 [Ignavibacteriales bacterium]|nr:hypothetical protein [Ignavibacteriales bacterium]